MGQVCNLSAEALKTGYKPVLRSIHRSGFKKWGQIKGSLATEWETFAEATMKLRKIGWPEVRAKRPERRPPAVLPRRVIFETMPGIKTRLSRARLIRFVPPVLIFLLVVAMWVQSFSYSQIVATHDGMSGIGYGVGFLVVVMYPASDFGLPPKFVSRDMTIDRPLILGTGLHVVGGQWMFYLPLWWLAIPPLLWIGWLLRPWRWRRKRTDED